MVGSNVIITLNETVIAGVKARSPSTVKTLQTYGFTNPDRYSIIKNFLLKIDKILFFANSQFCSVLLRS
jgi:hypothetical protein